MVYDLIDSEYMFIAAWLWIRLQASQAHGQRTSVNFTELSRFGRFGW